MVVHSKYYKKPSNILRFLCLKQHPTISRSGIVKLIQKRPQTGHKSRATGVDLSILWRSFL